jgi:hypothetical protein
MSVQKIAISKALAFLKAAGAQFKVIEDDGTEHGELLAIKPKPVGKQRRNPMHPYGTFTDYAKQFIDDAKAGSLKLIPYGRFEKHEERQSLKSSLCAYCSKHWGNESYIINSTDDGIELLRLQ